MDQVFKDEIVVAFTRWVEAKRSDAKDRDKRLHDATMKLVELRDIEVNRQDRAENKPERF